MTISSLTEALEQVALGALVAVNHSGGKDSQAMLIHVLRHVPKEQVVVVHADLSSKEQIEWKGTKEHAEKQTADAGVPFIVAVAGKTLLEMVEHRFETRPEVPSWPSRGQRQCTSDLKRGPLEREIRRELKRRDVKIVISAEGMRAEESRDRKDLVPWTKYAAQSIASRQWFKWLPIHRFTKEQVFDTIREAGQQPHYAYALGNDRLSCVFCIMGNKNDARNGAVHNPDLYKRYVTLEQKTGYTSHMGRKSLVELTGLTVEQAYEENRRVSLSVVNANEPAHVC